jgi:hypothetical protein
MKGRRKEDEIAFACRASALLCNVAENWCTTKDCLSGTQPETHCGASIIPTRTDETQPFGPLVHQEYWWYTNQNIPRLRMDRSTSTTKPPTTTTMTISAKLGKTLWWPVSISISLDLARSFTCFGNVAEVAPRISCDWCKLPTSNSVRSKPDDPQRTTGGQASTSPSRPPIVAAPKLSKKENAAVLV